MEDVVQRRRRVFGPTHPCTADSEAGLSCVREHLASLRDGIALTATLVDFDADCDAVVDFDADCDAVVDFDADSDAVVAK